MIAIAGVGFAMLFRVMAPVGLYDYNFDTFERVLTREQGNAIIGTAEGQLSFVVIILTVTNVLWLALGAHLLRRLHELTRRGKPTDPGV